MNPQPEKQLEAAIRRELDTLGELHAPPALAQRILQVIAQRAAAPWYRRAWPTWPLALRMASLVFLMAVFVGLSLGAWEIARGAGLFPAGNWFADAGALWRTCGVLANLPGTILGGFGMGVIVTSLGLLFAACVACLGLGSACVRLALNKIES